LGAERRLPLSQAADARREPRPMQEQRPRHIYLIEAAGIWRKTFAGLQNQSAIARISPAPEQIDQFHPAISQQGGAKWPLPETPVPPMRHDISSKSGGGSEWHAFAGWTVRHPDRPEGFHR